MNVFRKNKKAKDQEDVDSGLAGSDPAPVLKSSRTLTWKKKKVVEEKPAFDLDAALPQANEFRTSLLMPNLSARFSMLREQDDPTTKVGKASDDSVLFPKRGSRMNLFDIHPLTDIAEVESIHSSFRPPFADERNGSTSEGYQSDDGSVMNRSRPGEGNALFGGRQKLYRIATSSTKDLSSSRHVYDGDVSMSAFQQIRQKEKTQREQQREQDENTDRSSYPNTDLEDHDSTQSPLTAFSQNRGTQSSTNSGPFNRRTSTAATSVESESPLPQQSSNAAVNKVKDLDANSSVESIGFATSPGLRTVIREDGRPVFRLSGSRSPLNGKDSTTRQSPVPQTQLFRGISPPPSSFPQPVDVTMKDSNRSQPSPARFHAASPNSQFNFELDDTLAGSVRPNDRGKATAMGLFNKPHRHYDDTQFQQRQVQLHEGRNSPASTNSRTASRASPEPPQASRPSVTSVHSNVSRDSNSTPQIPPIPAASPSPAPNTRRSSAASTGQRSSTRPRAKSSASAKEAAVKARLESLIRKQNAELAAWEETEMSSRTNEVDEGKTADKNGSTFFDNTDDSDDDAQPNRQSESKIRIEMPAPPTPTDIHPALRDSSRASNSSSSERRPSIPRNSSYSVVSRTRPSSDRNRQSEIESIYSVQDVNLPVEPGAGLGLSGFIQHLRQGSNASSLLPAPSPALSGAENLRGSFASTTRTVTESVKSDPFEFDNDKLAVPDAAASIRGPPTPTTEMSQHAHHFLEAAKAMREAQLQADKTPKLAPLERVESPDQITPEADSDLPNHQRNESTDTQLESRRFDEELAARRKRIHEKMKDVQDRSKSKSPERSAANTGHGFSLPRFPVKPNISDRPDAPVGTKAMKTLGIPQTAQENPYPRIQESMTMDKDRFHATSSRQGQRPPRPQDSERPNGRRTPNATHPVPRPGPPQSNRQPPPRMARSTTPSERPGLRSRSASGTERSASRNKQIPEFDRAMMPGAFPVSPLPNISPPRNQNSPPNNHIDRPYERSGSGAAGRYGDRSNYFDSKPLALPEINGNFTPRPSPRPSPNPLMTEGRYTPTLATPMSPPSSALPSPNPAASGNGRTTPSTQPGRTTPSGVRKRSVTKGMISDPTFVSSTSSVPLVYLPRDGGPPVQPILPPPLPEMNPRRRGNTAGEQLSASFSPHPAVRPNVPVLEGMSESLDAFDFTPQSPPSKQRNRLKKSSSEGGNLAARARQQALAAEMAYEKDRSPNVAVFPNRSATSLPRQDGGMF